MSSVFFTFPMFEIGYKILHVIKCHASILFEAKVLSVAGSFEFFKYTNWTK